MKRLFAIFLFLFSTSLLFAMDSDPCRKSTEGTDFWFGFMESRNYNTNHYLEITVTAREATTFRITIGTEETPYNETYTIGANEEVQIRINNWELVETLGSETIENTGIHLVSEKPVNVYALNYDRNSADVAVIYPVESLGNEYFAMCYEPHIHEGSGGAYGNGRNSQFLVVATEDSSKVLIIPSAKTDKLINAGDTISICMKKGETFQVQSMNRNGLAGQGDLTGSYILSDKPVAFYSGSLATTVPATNGVSAWDHLYEQIPPIRSWGREYYAVPLKSREQDRYRIMAAQDSTTVYIEGMLPIQLNRGEYNEIVLYYNEAKRIFSEKPIMVAQYSQSKSVDQSFTGGNGDPFMIILSSTTQSKNDVTFVAYSSDIIKKYFVNIITLTEEIPNLRFNNSPLSSSEFKTFPDKKYSYAQKEINKGTYRINNINKDRGFLAYVYGYGGVESYGYGVGFNLDLVLDLGESINFNGDTLLLCYGDTRTLDAGPYFDTYSWNTKDTTQTVDITQGGKYYVETTTVDGCVLEDSIYVFMSHPTTELGLEHDDGCDPYSIELDGNAGFESYLWQNEDGDTLSSNQTLIADKTNEYRITVYDQYNCVARDTMNLVVFPVPKIKISGEKLICGEENSSLTVAITDAPEAEWNYPGSFTWSCDNTNLKFLNDTHTSTNIEVTDWGEYSIFYRLETINGCETIDTFKVTFHPLPNSAFTFEDDAKCEGYSKKLLFSGTATDSAFFHWDLDGCIFTDTLGWQQYNVSVGAFLEEPPFIKLVINDNGCWSDTTSHPLGAKPNFTMEADPLRGCDELTTNFSSKLLTDDDVVFEWKFHDGEIIKNPIASKHYSSTGYFDVSLTITNPVTGCQNGFTLDSMVKVFPTPVAAITADENICYPDSASIFYTHNIDSSFCKWELYGAHQSGVGNDSIGVVLDDPTAAISLTVDEYGCVSAPFEMQLKRKPHFNFYADEEDGCQPFSVEIFAKALDSSLYFNWILDSLPYPTGNANVYLFPDSGRFDVSIIASSSETNCFDTLLKPDYIWVHPKPLSEFDVDYPVALLERADITYSNYSVDATNYTWDFGDEEISVEENPVHTYTELGEFSSQLIVESNFGCKDTSDMLIKILPFSVFTPNAFRPNSEIPENRTFMPVGTGADLSRFSLKIYDRWGQIIFETKTPEHPWDGNAKNGKAAPVGNYVWISNYFDIQGYEHKQKGQVLLIR